MNNKIIRLIVLIALIVGVVIFSLTRPDRFRHVIVDTTSQEYSYDEMMQDLCRISCLYPEWVDWEVADTTHEHRLIPVVRFGSQSAQRRVMVQAAMHAREYLSAQMVMAMLEHYAWLAASDGSVDGVNIRKMLGNVSFTILPMVNPDGVTISQRGIDGVRDNSIRRWISEMVDSGYDCRQIKSNARGVDLNRNFTNGFGQGRRRKNVRSFDFYPGDEPISEPETRMMLRIAGEGSFDCFLNYHTSGNLIYYGCGNASDDVNLQAEEMARIIGSHTGYEGYGPDSAAPNGSWADEVEVRFKRPSATIELGTCNPVPIREFSDLYRRNMPVWASLARWLTEE